MIPWADLTDDQAEECLKQLSVFGRVWISRSADGELRVVPPEKVYPDYLGKKEREESNG